jgi:hypothetical protein
VVAEGASGMDVDEEEPRGTEETAAWRGGTVCLSILPAPAAR